MGDHSDRTGSAKDAVDPVPQPSCVPHDKHDDLTSQLQTKLGGSNPEKGSDVNTVTDGDATLSDMHKPVKIYTMLENNPAVMNYLARQLGVSEELCFYDIYSLDPSDMLGVIPRPVFALLTTIPMTEAWEKDRAAEDSQIEWYTGAGPDEPVTWFQQKIIHGCGLIGLIHCVSNGVPSEMVVPESRLAAFLEETVPLKMNERAEVLVESDMMYEASQAAAVLGDSEVIRYGADEGTGSHFVAFVKGKDGNLWELEGSRKGPLKRGLLSEDEDAFSDRALDLGLRRLINIQQKNGGELKFSCIALAPSMG